MIFNGHIKDGKLRVVHRKEFDRQLATMSGDVTIKIAKKRRLRSTPQNRYYWGALVPICIEILKEYGYPFTPEQCHDFLKTNFNTETLTNETTGEALTIPLSTTDLTTVQFEEYMERIRVWAWEFASVAIPEPNQQTEIF